MSGYELTAMDVKALRGADTICADWFTTKYSGEEKSQLRAIKESRNKGTDPYAEDITYTIAVPSTLTDYAARYTSSSDDGPPVKRHGYVHLSNSQFSETVHTIIGLLRVGDEISLHWMKDNQTGSLTEAGMHADELRLIVYRNNKRLTFTLEHRVGPDNLARMMSRPW